MLRRKQCTCSFGFWGFWLITRGLLLWYRCVYFYQYLFIINYFEVSMSHWDNNDRVETMKRGNREYAETRKLERRREEFLEGNWLGEFLLLQKHDGEQPIGTYPVPADKPRRSSPTHPTRPPPVLKRRVQFPSSLLVAMSDRQQQDEGGLCCRFLAAHR
jgi:hypothetical protein